MAESDVSDAGCIKALTSCLRSRSKKSIKPPVIKEHNHDLASPTSDAREPTQPAPGIAQTSATLPPPLSIQTIVLNEPITKKPHQEEDEGLSAVASGEGSTTADSLTKPKSKIQTKLDLWREAYEELDDDTRKWIGEVPGVVDVKATTDNLVKLVRESEEKHKEATPKLKIGDREIIWRDYANNVITGLTAIGDIAITFAPAPSSAVWSGIKVLMKANVTQCEDLTAMLGCTDIVLSLARRGRVYEEVYIGESPSTDVQEYLRQTLVKVYKKCLEFLAFVDTNFKKNRLKSFLDALLCPGQGTMEVSAVRDLEKELDMATGPCQAQRSDEHDRLLRGLQEPLKRIDDRVATVLKKLDEAELEKVKETISSIPVGEQHGRIRQKRTPGTGEWLIQDQQRFLHWEQSSLSSIFWLQGKLGTGKSFLSSKVIDRYRYDDSNPAQNASQHDEGLAFFYCDRGNPVSLPSILRSYIRQLGEVSRRRGSIHEAMYKLYEDDKNIQNHMSNEACRNALLAMINTYPRTTLILDGLDEASRDIRRDLIETFYNLIGEAEHVLKVFIASRVETDIETEMKSFRQCIRMDTLDNTVDIEKFVERSISEQKAWEISDSTKKEVKEKLSEKRDAMFRWTYLQWERIREVNTDKGVKELLKKLPSTLREAYDEIYGEKESSSFELVVLQRAVRWVMAAQEPLSSDVLLSAIWTESQWKDENDDVISQTDLNKTQLESICRHLITNDPHLGVWRFPHASVAEYFEERSDPWIKDALAEVTTFLIRHLTKVCSGWSPPAYEVEGIMTESRSFLSPDSSALVVPYQNKLEVHTFTKWFLYAQRLQQDNLKVGDVVQALKRFLGETGTGRPSSREYQIYFNTTISSPASIYSYPLDIYTDAVEPTQDAAFGIVALGLHQLLAGWWDKDLDTSKLNDGGQDLLAIAAMYGHRDLCKSLLPWGFDVNRPVDKRNQSALGAAIDEYEIGTIEFLLQNGANPNRVMADGSLLCLAARLGVDIVQALLDHGADPNVSCGSGCDWDCALSRAACRGDLEVTKVLIQNKADVNPVSFTDYCGSPLANAVCLGRLSVVRLLIKCGADVNASLKSGKWGSVLAIAIHGIGDIDMIKCLIEEAGADPGLLTTSPPPDPSALRNSARDEVMPGSRAGESRIKAKVAYLVGQKHVKAQTLKDIGVPEEFLPPNDVLGASQWFEQEAEEGSRL